MDINKIIELLLSFMGGGQTPQAQRYFNSYPQGADINRGTYSSGGMLNQIVDWMAPNTKKIAPAFMTQFDFQQIRLNTLARNKLQEGAFPAVNPTFTRGVGLVSPTAAKWFGEIGTKNASGTQQVAQGILPFVPGLGTPQEQLQTYDEVSKYFSGPMMNKQGKIFNNAVNPQGVAITQALSSLTYMDKNGTNLLRRMPGFNMADMSDIMRLGLDYGMRTELDSSGETSNINITDLMSKTKGLAKAIDAGIAIYKTMDKEKVLQNILELTRGNISVNNPALIEAALYKFKAMSNAFNVSTSYLQGFGKQQSQILEQAGVKGIAAAETGMSTFMVSKMIRNAMTPEQIAFMGGEQKITEYQTMNQASFVASSAFKSMGMQFMAARELGLGSVSGVLTNLRSGSFSEADMGAIRGKLAEKAIKEGRRGAGVDAYVEGELIKFRLEGPTAMLESLNEGSLGGMEIAVAAAKGFVMEVAKENNMEYEALLISPGLVGTLAQKWVGMGVTEEAAYNRAQVQAKVVRLSSNEIEKHQKDIRQKTLLQMEAQVSRQARGIFYRTKELFATGGGDAGMFDLFQLYGAKFNGTEYVYGEGVTGEDQIRATKRLQVLKGAYEAIKAGKGRTVDKSEMLELYVGLKTSSDQDMQSWQATMRKLSGVNSIDLHGNFKDYQDWTKVIEKSGDADIYNFGIDSTQVKKYLAAVKKNVPEVNEATLKAFFNSQEGSQFKASFGRGGKTMVLATLNQMDNTQSANMARKMYKTSGTTFSLDIAKEQMEAYIKKRIEDKSATPFEDFINAVAENPKLFGIVSDKIAAEQGLAKPTQETLLNNLSAGLNYRSEALSKALMGGDEGKAEASLEALNKIGIKKEEIVPLMKAFNLTDVKARNKAVLALFGTNEEISSQIDITDEKTLANKLASAQFLLSESEKKEFAEIAGSLTSLYDAGEKTADNTSTIVKILREVSEKFGGLDVSKVTAFLETMRIKAITVLPDADKT